MPPSFSYVLSDMRDLNDIETTLPSPCSDPGYIKVKQESEDSNKECTWPGPGASNQRLVFQTSRKGKGIKKAHKSNKRWAKSEHKSGIRKSSKKDMGWVVHVAKDHEIEFHVQQLKRSEKNKYMCKTLIGGTRCAKFFERIEHLRRHERTHLFEKYKIPCPLPKKYNCTKVLDRRDNWRDHLKTHLRKSNSGRNERCEKEDMYDALRKNEKEEGEAEKTIEMLEKWFMSPKYLESLSVAPRHRH
jgi:hypothetical protein